jgi:Mce-associated membrane protein
LGGTDTADSTPQPDVESPATTDTGADQPVAPRRGGRHRWLRPRQPVAAAPARSEETVAEPDKPDEAPVPDEATADKPDEVPAAADDTVAAADDTVAAVDDTAAAVDDTADAVDDSAETADDTGDEAAPIPDEPPLAARKPVGRALVVSVIVAAALFVCAGAFAGAMLQPYLADKAAVDTKLDIARTATNAITTLWTYTPDNMETLPDRSAKYLAGDFEDQYRKYIDGIAPVNKQAKVTNNTQVVGAAVESLSGTDATAVVYTNTTNTSPQSNNIPSMKYLSYRLTMQRQDSRWVITKMTTITSLDLTPQLG